MEQIISYFAGYGLDLEYLLKAAGLLLVGSILLGAFGRFIFGKKSMLVGAVSSAIGIVFIYVLNVALSSAGAEFQQFITPLPFIQVKGDALILQSITGLHYTQLCGLLLSLLILALLANLIDSVIPRGKNVFTWSIFRILTVLLAQAAHLLVIWLIGTYVPYDLQLYAPVILLAVLALMLLTGALKIVVGAFIATVNPLIAALYTFFFANLVGKQITKAVFSTALLTGLVFLLEKLGIGTISIAMGALSAYIPFAVLLLVLWWLIGKLFE